MYSNGNHKLHKVYPIEKSYKQMARDVDLISRQSERELVWINSSISSITQYLDDEEKAANAAIISLARRFDQLQSELIKNF